MKGDGSPECPRSARLMRIIQHNNTVRPPMQPLSLNEGPSSTGVAQHHMPHDAPCHAAGHCFSAAPARLSRQWWLRLSKALQLWIHLWAHRPALARLCIAYIHRSASETHGLPPPDLQADVLVRSDQDVLMTHESISPTSRQRSALRPACGGVGAGFAAKARADAHDRCRFQQLHGVDNSCVSCFVSRPAWVRTLASERSHSVAVACRRRCGCRRSRSGR